MSEQDITSARARSLLLAGSGYRLTRVLVGSSLASLWWYSLARATGGPKHLMTLITGARSSSSPGAVCSHPTRAARGRHPRLHYLQRPLPIDSDRQSRSKFGAVIAVNAWSVV